MTCTPLAAVALALQASFGHASAACEEKSDPHGVWTGSTQLHGFYSLTCKPGYTIMVGVGNRTVQVPSQGLRCQKGGWEEHPVCVNIDDCSGLKHNCGLYGVCVDEVNSYHCRCEPDVKLVRMNDGSGEMVCGTDEKACNGGTCGAHGICIELHGEDAAGGKRSRCSCAKGYRYDSHTCAPKDCGALVDQYGIWEGVHSYGGQYTLTCSQGSLIQNSVLHYTSLACSEEGVWPEDIPRCVNAWQETVDARLNSFRFWFCIFCSIGCISTAAVVSGLTLGLVGYSSFDMRLLRSTRLEECETREHRQQLRRDKVAAQKIQPVIQNHHQLLVTLLLLNSLANEALPIFLDQLMSSFSAVIFSVTCVLFFGEILPSALFTGPSQLQIAATFAPIVKVLMCLTFPIVWPISKILDHLVGHEEDGPKYTRAQLKAILRLQVEGADEEEDSELDSGSSTQDDHQLVTGRSSQRSLRGRYQIPKHTRSSSFDSEVCEKPLEKVEGMFAERSLSLSKLRLGDLPCLDVHLPEGTPVEEVSVNSTVDFALQRLRASLDRSRCVKIMDSNNVCVGTATRERLLCVAMMQEGMG